MTPRASGSSSSGSRSWRPSSSAWPAHDAGSEAGAEDRVEDAADQRLTDSRCRHATRRAQAGLDGPLPLPLGGSRLALPGLSLALRLSLLPHALALDLTGLAPDLGLVLTLRHPAVRRRRIHPRRRAARD